MPAPIIYLNGWPGVGKHTVAKALANQLKGKGRVVHNHQHIDLAGATLPRSSSQYYELRHQIREVIFSTLATNADTFDHIYIFTDSQSDNEIGRAVAEHHAKVAKDRGCTFIPVVLTCDADVNAQRMRSQERQNLVAGGKGMLLDTTLLHEFRSNGEILRFSYPELLDLDVSDLIPEKAAARIAQHITFLEATAQTHSTGSGQRPKGLEVCQYVKTRRALKTVAEG